MNLSLTFYKSTWFVFFLPALVILSAVLIVQTGLFWQAPEALAIGITCDLALTSPLVYLFLIRNKPIPKTTVVPFFVIGLWIATYLLPKEYQSLLDLFWIYLLPLLELGIMVFIILKTRQTIRQFKKSPYSNDFLSRLRYSAIEVSGSARLGNILATEIAMFYYSLLNWRSAPENTSHSFSYHRKSGTSALYGALLLLLVIETIAFHIVIALWWPIIAWVLTIGSLYAVIQLLGHLKACRQRPIVLAEDKLLIRHGLAGDVEIPFSSISEISLTKKFPDGEGVLPLALLKSIEPFNIAIELKEPLSLRGLYGLKKNFRILLLHVDQKEDFVKTIQSLKTRES